MAARSVTRVAPDQKRASGPDDHHYPLYLICRALQGRVLRMGSNKVFASRLSPPQKDPPQKDMKRAEEVLMLAAYRQSPGNAMYSEEIKTGYLMYMQPVLGCAQKPHQCGPVTVWVLHTCKWGHVEAWVS